METNPEMRPESDAVASLRAPAARWWVILVVLGLVAFVAVYALLAAMPVRNTAQPAAAAVAIPDPFKDIQLIGKSAYVYDTVTGRVLYEKNAEAQLPLASITKVALALAIAESVPLDSSITIPHDTSPAGSAERLAAGEVWKVKDVINFTLVASSNEGANILASTSDDAIRAKFPTLPEGGAALARMNAIAQNIGLTHTYFRNVSGLDLSETQAGSYSSAHDVALLMAYAASTSPSVFAATAKDGVQLVDENGNKTSAFNTNEALGDIPGLMMGKTGYTDLAGGNLAVVFDVGLAHPVVAVVMGSTYSGRFEDMKQLVSATRASITNAPVVEQ